MKKIILLVGLNITQFVVFGQNENVKINPLKISRGIYYVDDSVPKIISGKLYTGNDTSYVFEGKEKMLAIETFKDGYKVELKTFYDNGNMECHFQWKNFKRDGISKKMYKNGNVMFDNLMKEGKDIGTSITYYENGNPKFIGDKEKGFAIGFYEDGKMKSFSKNIKDSIKCGDNYGFEETKWYKNGQLESKWIYNCGKQQFKEFYNDSTLAGEGTIISMSLFFVGKHTEWFENGKLKIEGQYEDGNTQREANIKTGTWRYYNEKGELIKEEYYENNKLKNVKNNVKEKQMKKLKD